MQLAGCEGVGSGRGEAAMFILEGGPVHRWFALLLYNVHSRELFTLERGTSLQTRCAVRLCSKKRDVHFSGLFTLRESTVQ